MAAAQRTPLQQFHDYLFSQVEIVTTKGNNKRIHCKKCKHNFSGNAGRIHDHLISKLGGCSFSETPCDKRDVLDTVDALVNALPKGSKRNAVVLATTAVGSSDGLVQGPIEQALQAASKSSVDQAVADWVYETSITSMFSGEVFDNAAASYGDHEARLMHSVPLNCA